MATRTLDKTILNDIFSWAICPRPEGGNIFVLDPFGNGVSVTVHNVSRTSGWSLTRICTCTTITHCRPSHGTVRKNNRTHGHETSGRQLKLLLLLLVHVRSLHYMMPHLCWAETILGFMVCDSSIFSVYHWYKHIWSLLKVWLTSSGPLGIQDSVGKQTILQTFMQTKYLCVLIHIWIKSEVVAV